MSTLEANKALVRRHFADALHDPSVCDALYAPTLAQAIKDGAARRKVVWSADCYGRNACPGLQMADHPSLR
jgi:hypothetical protein